MTESESPDAREQVAEELVAYLDGELDQDASQDVERRLAESDAYRRELRQLQRAWDMLDELPRAQVGDTFTQTTVEMVALSAQRDLQELHTHGQQRRRLMWIAGGMGLAASALAGYLAVAAYLARPNDQLVQDLPVIEDLDLYEIADSVTFLRQLQNTGLFDEEENDVP
jgi:anti-sigma factor RsiW